MGGEDAREIFVTLYRLMVAIDRELGVTDAGAGEFRQACCKKKVCLTQFDHEKKIKFFV
jgi:hypothetical protein